MQRITIALVFVLLFHASLFAETTFKSLLVSIEKYEIAPLDYAENDIMRLANLLMTRYDGVAQACVDSAAKSGEIGEDAPLNSVKRKIEDWCDSLGSGDTAILYLAGHGVKDDDGKLYLAMINFNRKNYDKAAIPLRWIRDKFGECKAQHKLLLLDTCFAGTSKSIDLPQANNGEVGGAFADLKDVVTIASSRENEKSWLWGEAKHSLFTYWLIEAFKGHADLNGDRVITCEELVEYLETNVSWIAEEVLEQKQHPVVLNAPAGASLKLPLRAISLNRLIDDVAEQIDLQMRIKKLLMLGVPEFTSGDGNRFDPRYGSLPKWAAEELSEAIAKKIRKNKSNYEILSENALRELLQSKGITPDDLGAEKTRNLSVEGHDIPVLTNGHMKLFEKSGMSLRTVLLNTKTKGNIAKAGGVAMLSAAELGMTETSGVFSAAQSCPPPRPLEGYVEAPGLGLVSLEQRRDVVEVLEKQEKPHPMADPKSPFKVGFEVRPMNNSRAAYVKRNVVVEGNNCYLPLSKGEEYRIKVKCETEHEVFTRILVDGLNTLSQKTDVKSKDITIEAVDPQTADYEAMPRASLENARAWAMQPGKEFVIEGFYNVKMNNSTLRRFQIVDADESVAARKSFTDQIGLITIGFFKPVPSNTRGAGKIGTGAGRDETIKVEIYKGDNVAGPMMAVYNIRYLTPEALKNSVK